MPKKKYVVELSPDEKEKLLDLINHGKQSSRTIKRANILLLAAQDKTDEQIVENLSTSMATVERTRQRFVEGNLDYALTEKRRSGRPKEFDEKQEAYLVALACSDAPEGRKCWTMQLLAERLMEMNVTDQISDETVRLRLKKTRSSRGNEISGVFLI